MAPTLHHDLFGRIANFESLRQAALRAARGKRRTPAAAAFLARLEPEILALTRELQAEAWQPGAYTVIELKRPVARRISAAPFRDRVVHHAVCGVVQPIFERGFVDDTYANRVGRGSHAAVARYEAHRDRHAHVLRADVFRYFPSIDHDILKRVLRRRIACARTLYVLDRIIDGSNLQEPVYLLFPGDDLLSQADRRRGLPIGNLTSQFFANLYLDAFDHFVTEVLRAPYVRYVDDFALFHRDPGKLLEWRHRIEDHLVGRRLVLHPRKTWNTSTAEPATFLGFELHADGRRRLPEAHVDLFASRLRGMRQQFRRGLIDREEVGRRINGWLGHAGQAHTRGLQHALLRDGWFDPFWKDGRPVVWQATSPGVPGGCCAAARGTTIHRTCARPTATGTPPTTATGTTVSA